MIDSDKMKVYQYCGSLAAVCEEFVSEKRALGYIYNTEAKKLSEFSRFSLDYEVPHNVLTKEVVQQWIARKPTDSDRNQYARYSLISQFANYMNRMGYTAYVPARSEIGKLHKAFVPYIFTHEEIHSFFAAADALTRKTYSVAPRRHLVMPVLFRMLYCCGLRVSEAIMLKGEDVDLETGVLTIRDSKFGKTRYVPMSPELTSICTEYAQTRLVGKAPNDWFFAAPDGGHYDTRSIYSVFRDLLWDAGISHGGRGKGPRLHDFRHTFCVHCLQQWISQGKDLTTALPLLTTYMGHNDFSATEQYLRMTAEVYPEISQLMQERYGYVVKGKEVSLE